ncbi:MAG: TlpA family protein disulfide reductase [Chitinophagaceae bacterium]|nr:TlpA family protein disulfide reductase [Chitinophagaceae bacterium]
MKRVIFIATFYCLSCTAGINGQEFNIRGKINYPDTLMILFGSKHQSDTLISPEGEFHFTREINYPELLTIAAVDIKNTKTYNLRRFFADDGTAHLETDFNSLGDCSIQMTNTKYNTIYEDFRERFDPLVSIARKVIDTSYSKDLTNEGKGLCNKLYDFINEVEGHVIEKFISNNSDNIVGAYIFNNYFNTQANVDKAQVLYSGFSPELLKCPYLKEVKSKLEAAQKITVGLAAPAITATALDSKRIEFGKEQNKYTVIDFWGTWCAPCLKGFSRMKKYYQIHKEKINFVGVAYNDNRSNVKSFIETHKIVWPQIINNEQNTNLEKAFNIYAAPTKIIIDKQGRVLKIFVGETDDFYTYIDNLK